MTRKPKKTYHCAWCGVVTAVNLVALAARGLSSGIPKLTGGRNGK